MENFDIEKVSNGGRKLFYEHKKALAIGFGVGACLKYLTAKYHGKRKGRFKDINTIDWTVKDPTFFENLPPGSNGRLLEFVIRLANSNFGQYFGFNKYTVNQTYIELIRCSIISEKATYYPVHYSSAKTEKDRLSSPNQEVTFVSKMNKNCKFQPVTIADYTEAYKTGISSPLDVATEIIREIPEMNKKLNILCEWDVQMILKQAEESTERWKAGKPLSDLDGVPIAIKDQIDIKGLTVRNGLPFPESNPAKSDGAIIEKIKNAGMIIVGLVNMHQVGLSSIGTNDSKFHGDCKNPHNTDFYCGASSSGTGAIVACGLVPCGVGSDGGGSVRIPASWCQNNTIKPSCGRIPQRGYISGTNSTLGPMCNTMTDCAKLYSIIAGPDLTKDSDITIFQPPVNIPREIRSSFNGLKIGVDRNWTNFKVDSTISGLFKEKLKYLENKGCEIVSITIPEIDYYHASHFVNFMQEIASRGREYIENDRDISGDFRMTMITNLDNVFASDYVQANRIRTKFMKITEILFQKVDLIATPTTREGAMKRYPGDEICGRMDGYGVNHASQFTKFANFVGIPAVSCPMGTCKNGLPVGFHLMSSWWREDLLIELGVSLESEYTFIKPKVYFRPEFAKKTK